MMRLQRLIWNGLRLAALILALSPPLAFAHEIRPAIATLSLQDSGRADLELRFDLEAVLSGLARQDTAEATTVYERLRALEADALRMEMRNLAPALPSEIAIRFDGEAAALLMEGLEIPSVGDVALPRLSMLRLRTSIPSGASAVLVAMPTTFGNHVVRIVEQPGGRVLFAGMLNGGEASPNTRLSGEGRPAFNVLRYGLLGFEHILPKGLDHILFVIGLFLLSPRLRPLLWQVSAFTLAHSVTLALGIYGVLEISPRLVEPLIAASIVFVALENLFTPTLSRWRPAVIFLFGLLHGLGFAGVLAEIGLPEEQFLAALIGFNLGVEAGQIAVLAGCFLAVGLWFRNRTWYRGAVTIPASVAIALIGGYWFVERLAA